MAVKSAACSAIEQKDGGSHRLACARAHSVTVEQRILTDQNQPMPEPQTGLDRFQSILRRNPVALLILFILVIGVLGLLSKSGNGPSAPGSSPSTIGATITQPAPAQTYENAEAAAKRGDYATAMRIIRPLADQGNAKAQDLVGTIYQEGWGVPRDHAEAAKWFRRAANQGDATAQFGLGTMYRDGEGVPQDYIRSYMWYSLAALTNDATWSRNALMARDLLVQLKHVTATQIAEAQRLASEWKPER